MSEEITRALSRMLAADAREASERLDLQNRIFVDRMARGMHPLCARPPRYLLESEDGEA